MIKKKIKFPKKISQSEIIEFFKEIELIDFNNILKSDGLTTNLKKTQSAYKPDIEDLYRIYKFITLNKRTTILEFGSGWSTLVMSAALGRNKHLYKNKIKNLRRNNPHEIFVLENEKKFLDISKKRLIKHKKKIKNYNFAKIHWKFSDVEMINFNNKLATQYKILPLCNPDFIYLDGPDQFNIKNSINGFNIAHKDLMPMSSDILKIEFFLVPGTIILIDGRGANANFLKLNFKRNWLYSYDKEYDQHIFYLNDESFGVLNDKLLKFYKS